MCRTIIIKHIVVTIIIASCSCALAQIDKKEPAKHSDSIRLLFYNVENLFDPFDDSLTNDDAFTPEGERAWTWKKYQEKLSKVYKTIMVAGNPLPPAIIGLCEVENRFVLNQLAYKTPLSKMDYRIVHEESPDRRGIDVALLFNPHFISLIDHQTIPIFFSIDSSLTTRDILYAKLLVKNADTLHVFVNHWPSRWGGQMASESKRIDVSIRLKQKIDSINVKTNDAHIIIMGDFNDQPWDVSLEKYLNAGDIKSDKNFINLSYFKTANSETGTIKYQGTWNIFDQIIVSRSLKNPDATLFIKSTTSQRLDHEYLFEPDNKHTGKKPFRTFRGFKYNGGYSDHLPVYVDIHLNGCLQKENQ
jgi:predicted extracellular nuclease